MDLATAVPYSIVSGTTVEFELSFDDFPASEWTAAIHIRGEGAMDAPGTASGEAHAFVLPASATPPAIGTGTLPAGEYQYEVLCTERNPVGTAAVKLAERGALWVEPNFATAAAGAIQSFDGKLLAAVRAELLRRMQGGVIENYSVSGGAGGTTVARMPTPDLYRMRDQLEARENMRRRGGIQTVRCVFPPRRTLA